MKRNKSKLVAIVDTLNQLVPMCSSGKEISLHVGAVDARDGKPRNFRFDWEFPLSFGGCSARIFGAEGISNPNLFSYSGPSLAHCDNAAEYQAGAWAIGQIKAKFNSFYETRGNPVDAAEMMGRWLEACGVTEIYMREGEARYTWLTDGEWKVWTIGRTVAEIRAKLCAKSAATEPAAEKEAA